MLRLIVILIILLTVGAKGYSQSIDSEYKNNIIKVLSSKYVSDVVEDLEGYIWIATDEGVYRYNGTKSIHFTVKDGLPTNDIIYLNVDSKNRVWLTGFYSGLYYIENKVVKKVVESENSIDIAFGFEKNDTIYFHDKEVNNSYYYTKGKFFTYKNKLFPKNQIIDYYKKNNLTVEYDFYKIFINNKHISLNSDDKSLFLYCPNLKYNTPTFIKINESSNFPFIKREILNSFFAYENKKLFRYKIDNTLSESDTIYNFGKFENKNHSIFLTSKNKIIVNSNGIYNKVLSEKLNKLQFNFSDFYFVYIDSKNNFWFIDKNKTLRFVSNSFDATETIFFKQKFLNNEEYIKDFIKHNEHYVIATNKNRIYSFTPKTQQIQLIKDYKNSTLNNLFLKQDTLIVNQLSYLNKFKIKEENIIEVSKSATGYKTVAVFEKELFSSTGRFIYDSKLKEFWREKEKKITAMALDATYLYLTTYNHVIKLNKKTKKSIKAPIKNGSKIAIINNGIVAVTNEGQVLLFDKNLQLLDQIDLDEKISAIKYDASSNWIYVQTKKAITFYSKNKYNKLQFEYQINNLSIDDRIVALNYDKDFIYYSTQNTINKVKKHHLIKPLQATLDIDNGVVIGTDEKVVTNALLKRKENSLQFDVSLKTYNNPNDFSVYYDLLHNEHIVIKNEKITTDKLTFYNLNPGKYTIHFKVVPKYGNSKPVFSSFSFTIDYYFWETIWFKILSILVLIAVTTSILLHFRNKKYRKIRKKIQLNELELKALRAQMSPHFMFNTLNSMQSSVLLDDEIKVNNYFAKFAKLLRSTLDIVNKEHITLIDEIAYIDSYIAIENLKSNSPISLIYDIDQSIDISKMKVPVMLLQPFVENAVIHGLSGVDYKKILKISINRNSNSIIISIEDNGVGRNTKKNANKEEFRTSYATKIVQNRLSLYKDLFKKDFSCEIIDLVDANNQSIGTKVILTIAIIDSFNINDVFN